MKMRQLLPLLFMIQSLAYSQSGWTPSNMMQYKRVGGVSISPDGKQVAFTVADARMTADQSDFLSHVWVASADGTNVQFTFGDTSCSNPKFSPDNQYLSFTSSRGEGGINQIYRVRLNGGEAEQITSGPDNVANYAWSPDSKQIAFTMLDSVKVQDTKNTKEKTDWQVVDDFDNAQLFVTPLSKDAKGKYPVVQLTSGPYHVNEMNWSPDGQSIVFSHQAGSWANAWTTADFSVVPAKGGAIKSLVARKGMDASPVFSPDGKWIAFVTTNGEQRWASKNNIAIIPSEGGTPKVLAGTQDHQQDILSWTVDGKAILISEAFHTTAHIYSLPVDGSQPTKLSLHTKGTIGAISINRKGDAAYIYQATEAPAEIYMATLANMNGKKVTDIHRDYMMNQPLAKSEVTSWKSKDRKYTIEGIVTYPHGYQKGKKYPMILNVHGGPAGVFQEAYTGQSSTYPIQAFAAKGYVVLRANPRGSTGYGAEFRQANHRDWGYGDYDDLMTGVDKLIGDGVVHPDSLVITGWSYGGYMTSMVITKTNRFKAAMAGAPVTNLMSFNGTADIPDFLPSYFEKEFWDDPEVYSRHSAMFNIKNAQTPTLVIHGLSDDRVPPEQGFQLHRALKQRGIPAEMVVYPRQPHGFREPKFIQNVGDRTMAWFDEYLRKKNQSLGGKQNLERLKR